MNKITTLIYRGKLIESVHNIKCYLGSISGEKLFSTDNENDYIYPRSSIKIFQAIPFVSSNSINYYNLNHKQIALSCSSHCGESYHIKELKNWLKKTKLKKTDLLCGTHSPIDKKSSEKLFLSGHKPYQLYNNCSGKHLAMLSNCVINRYPIKNYVNYDHPHQKKIRAVFSKFTEKKVMKKSYAIDGCSAPQYAFKIKELGKALKNLLKSFNSKFDYSEQIILMINSILENPLFIGGSNNLDSNLIRISNKKIYCKGGAEGVFLFLHLEKGIFGILKVIDGNERALSSAIYSLSKKFNLLNKEELKNFKLWNNFKLYNHAKINIGKINTIIS